MVCSVLKNCLPFAKQKRWEWKRTEVGKPVKEVIKDSHSG